MVHSQGGQREKEKASTRNLLLDIDRVAMVSPDVFAEIARVAGIRKYFSRTRVHFFVVGLNTLTVVVAILVVTHHSERAEVTLAVGRGDSHALPLVARGSRDY